MQITLDIDNEQDLLLLLSITNRIGIKEFKEALLVILPSGKRQQEQIVNFHSDKCLERVIRVCRFMDNLTKIV